MRQEKKLYFLCVVDMTLTRGLQYGKNYDILSICFYFIHASPLSVPFSHIGYMCLYACVFVCIPACVSSVSPQCTAQRGTFLIKGEVSLSAPLVNA